MTEKAAGARSSGQRGNSKTRKSSSRAHTPDSESPPLRLAAPYKLPAGRARGPMLAVLRGLARGRYLEPSGTRWAWSKGAGLVSPSVHSVTIGRLLAAGLVELTIRREGLVDCRVIVVPTIRGIGAAREET